MDHSRADRITAWTLVGIQAVLIVGIVIVPERADWPLPSAAHVGAWVVVGVAVVVALWGMKWLGRGLTASPLPNGRTDLVVHGPYRWVRHPIYTAVMLGGAGVAYLARSWVAAACAGGLILLFVVKARWEERRLIVTFPDYLRYAASTGRFVPGVGRIPS